MSITKRGFVNRLKPILIKHDVHHTMIDSLIDDIVHLEEPPSENLPTDKLALHRIKEYLPDGEWSDSDLESVIVAIQKAGICRHSENLPSDEEIKRIFNEIEQAMGFKIGSINHGMFEQIKNKILHNTQHSEQTIETMKALSGERVENTKMITTTKASMEHIESKYQKLFDFLFQEANWSPLTSDMDELISIVKDILPEQIIDNQDSNFLELENYVPINLAFVKIEWSKIYNIPNNQWDNIEQAINTINQTDLPTTLRLFLLNHLPYCIIKLLTPELSEEIRLGIEGRAGRARIFRDEKTGEPI